MTGELSGSHPIALFRNREDAEWFATVADRELERIFREGYEQTITESTESP